MRQLKQGAQLNSLYCALGHLHQVNLDSKVITDIERRHAHRMIDRTQVALVSRGRRPGRGQPHPVYED